jgi:hypothetical protein
MGGGFPVCEGLRERLTVRISKSVALGGTLLATHREPQATPLQSLLADLSPLLAVSRLWNLGNLWFTSSLRARGRAWR